jgi:dipeptidyl aminopeptidase/acylaminoacyl peptidase
MDADIADALFSKQIGMLSITPATFDELLNAFADLPGVKLAPDHDVTIDFRNPSTAAPTSSVLPSTQSPPDTDVFLSALASHDGKLSIGPPINISSHRGYDNQPSFTPDGRNVLFASVRGASGPVAAEPARSPQTDIYRYEIASRRIWRVTNTPEGEFSPTVMPDGKRISVVRVEADGTQRLWSLVEGAAQSEMTVILPDVKPVGYYAWIDEHAAALFVLGENGQPPTLQVADLRTGRTEQVAVNIGRSIQRMPSGTISFVQREATSAAATPPSTIKQLLNKTAGRQSIGTAPLIQPAAGASDPFLVWTPDGTLLMAAGSTLYQWRAGERSWSVAADLGAFGLREVSRLAVSPQGDRLAIVAQAR